jgi:hypothetical protein
VLHEFIAFLNRQANDALLLHRNPLVPSSLADPDNLANPNSER